MVRPTYDFGAPIVRWDSALFSTRPTWASPARAGLVETVETGTTWRCPNAGSARAQRESGACSVGRGSGLNHRFIVSVVLLHNQRKIHIIALCAERIHFGIETAW